MAHLERRYRKRQRAYVYEIRYRDSEGRTRRKTIDTSDSRVARAKLVEFEAQEGGRISELAFTDPMAALDRFLLDMHHLAEATRRYYRRQLTAVFKGLSHKPITRWNRQLLADWIKARGWAARTEQMHIASCKRFISWARECGYPCPDFVGTLKARPKHATEPKHLTPLQFDKLLAAARADPHGQRYVVVLNEMLSG